MISWSSWGFNRTTHGPPATALHLQEFCFGVVRFCLFWGFSWLVFGLLVWGFFPWGGGVSGERCLKERLNWILQRWLAKGGYGQPMSASTATPTERGVGRGDIFPKSGFYSLIGERPKKPQALTRPTPSALSASPRPPVTAVPPRRCPRQPRSRSRPQPCPWQRVPGEGRRRALARDRSRWLQVSSPLKGKLTETPGLVGFVCLRFNIYLIIFAHVFSQNNNNN